MKNPFDYTTLTWSELLTKTKDWFNSPRAVTEALKRLKSSIDNIEPPTGDFIPLNGTTDPITGVLESNEGLIIKGDAPDVTSTGGVGIGTNDDAIFSLTNSNGGILNTNFNEITSESTINVSGDRGIGFDIDVSGEITDLEYTQKIYVDNPETLINTLNNANSTQLDQIKSILGIV